MRTLIIEARHLDTDGRTVASVEVDVLSSEVDQREQIASAVTELHPGAQLRSFAGGAASFLASDHLVVAHYATDDQGHDADVPPADDRPAAAPQQPLFAA